MHHAILFASMIVSLMNIISSLSIRVDVFVFFVCLEHSIAIAGSAIRHLTRIGVITTDNDDSTCSDKERNRRQQLRNDDAPLLLSKRAQDRAYFPEGILDHHHAIQFITFSPSFESANDNHTPVNEEPVGTATPTGFSSFHNTTSKSASDSRYDARSSLLGCLDSTGKRIPGILTLGVRRVIAGPKSRRQKSSPSLARRGHGSNNDSEEKQYMTTSGDSNKNRTVPKNAKREQKIRYNGDSSCAPVGCFSKLKCLRGSSNETTAKTRKSDTFGNSKPSPQKTMTSLSEEEEKRWLAYSMKPIDEDQSLANASVVSMSAPLLSPS
jgi:hypothetical protein